MKLNRVLMALLVLTLAVLACQVPSIPMPATQLPPPTPAALQIPNPVAVDLEEQQGTLVSLYNHVMPGIVSLQVLGDQGGSLGSGFVYDDQGHIITNFHVVEGAKQVEVDFTSGYKVYGTVIGTDLDLRPLPVSFIHCPWEIRIRFRLDRP